MTHTRKPDGDLKWWCVGIATCRKLNLWLSLVFLTTALVVPPARAEEFLGYPGFRHVDPASLAPPQFQLSGAVLAADQDFAPWSFLDASGQLKGIAVELAVQACAAAQLQCTFQPMPYDQLLGQLRAGKVSAVISGPQLTPEIAAEFQPTRPYFKSSGRFVVRTGSSIKAPDIRSLAGLRLGMVANTSHARFLEQYYGRSALTPFDTPAAMLEALRTGQLDAAFGDTVALAFWQDGEASRGCCSYLGKAMVSEATFTRSLGFVVASGADDVRSRLDIGLDQLEANGTTASILARYLPQPVW